MKTTNAKVAKRTKTKTKKPKTDGLQEWLEGRPALLGQLDEMRRITQNEEGGHDLLAQARYESDRGVCVDEPIGTGTRGNQCHP